MSALKVGESVRIRYTGYIVNAVVLAPEDRYGWVDVRQDEDYMDLPEAERPHFKALREYVFRAGEIA